MTEQVRSIETGEDLGSLLEEKALALKWVEHLPQKSPHLEQLAEYSRGVDGKIATILEEPRLSLGEANLLLSQMSREDLKAGFANMLLRVGQETDYMGQLERVGISADELAYGLDRGRYGAAVYFVEPESMAARIWVGRDVSAVYKPGFDIAVIKGKVPEAEMMWKMLVTDGITPDTVKALLHELTHDKQAGWLENSGGPASIISNATSLINLVFRVGWGSILVTSAGALVAIVSIIRNRSQDIGLTEMDAYHAANRFPGYKDEEMDEPEEVAAHVQWGYGLEGRPLEALIKAYENIVLVSEMSGKEPGEISRWLARVKYDKKLQTYPKLEQKVDDCMKNWGVEGMGHIDIVRRALLARRDIEVRYQRAKAREIAISELRRERGQESWVR